MKQLINIHMNLFGLKFIFERIKIKNQFYCESHQKFFGALLKSFGLISSFCFIHTQFSRENFNKHRRIRSLKTKTQYF